MDMRRQQRTIEVMATPAAAMQALIAQYAAVRAAAAAVKRRQREADRVVVHLGAQPRVRVLGRAPVVAATTTT